MFLCWPCCFSFCFHSLWWHIYLSVISSTLVTAPLNVFIPAGDVGSDTEIALKRQNWTFFHCWSVFSVLSRHIFRLLSPMWRPHHSHSSFLPIRPSSFLSYIPRSHYIKCCEDSVLTLAWLYSPGIHAELKTWNTSDFSSPKVSAPQETLSHSQILFLDLYETAFLSSLAVSWPSFSPGAASFHSYYTCLSGVIDPGCPLHTISSFAPSWLAIISLTACVCGKMEPAILTNVSSTPHLLRRLSNRPEPR